MWRRMVLVGSKVLLCRWLTLKLEHNWVMCDYYMHHSCFALFFRRSLIMSLWSNGIYCSQQRGRSVVWGSEYNIVKFANSMVCFLLYMNVLLKHGYFPGLSQMHLCDLSDTDTGSFSITMIAVVYVQCSIRLKRAFQYTCFKFTNVCPAQVFLK